MRGESSIQEVEKLVSTAGALSDNQFLLRAVLVQIGASCVSMIRRIDSCESPPGKPSSGGGMNMAVRYGLPPDDSGRGNDDV